MFKLFRPSCPVDASQKSWIESRLAWLCHRFGIERMLTSPVVLPTDGALDSYDGSETSSQHLFRSICQRMRIDDGEVILKFEPADSMRGLAGVYEAANPTSVVHVVNTMQEHGQSLLATLVHELAHHILLGQNHLSIGTADHEYVTDLFAVYAGFGVFAANSALRELNQQDGIWHKWSIRKQGYLAAHDFGYALGLYAFLRNEPEPSWQQYLRRDARDAFLAAVKYIRKTGDCLFHMAYERESRRPDDHELISDLSSQFDGRRIASLRLIADEKRSSENICAALMNCLRHENAHVRGYAVTALASACTDPRISMEATIECLNDSAPRVRASAVNALMHYPIGTKEMSRLQSMLRDDAREVVLQTIATIGGAGYKDEHNLERLQPVLKRALAHGDSKVTYAVIKAVTRMTTDVNSTLEKFFAADIDLKHLALDAAAELREQIGSTVYDKSTAAN